MPAEQSVFFNCEKLRSRWILAPGLFPAADLMFNTEWPDENCTVSTPFVRDAATRQLLAQQR
eukprot:gene3551-2901_t